MTTTTTTDDLSEVADTTEAEPVAPDEPSPRATLTLGEAAALGATLLIACIGAVALALAQVGRHDGWLSVLLGTALAAPLAVGAVTLGGRIAIRVDRAELVLGAVTVLAAGFWFLPGFPYAYGDKDPGAYVAHAFAIAEDGDVAIPDEVAQSGLAAEGHSGGQFPGIWAAYEAPGEVTSQFFHYTSALLATATDLGGRRALFNLTPLLAMLSVLVFVLAARRAAGTKVAALTAALLIPSMMQVWQAKYPSTEIPAQLFLGAALLAAVLAINQGWAGAAFVAGLLLGAEFLTRPDGFLYVVLAAGVAAVVVALGRADRRLVALGLGLVLSLPGAFWNAYRLREPYSEVNGLPGPATVMGACVALVLGAALVHRVRRWRDLPDPVALLRRWHRPLGVAAAVAGGLTLLVLWNRNTLFGQSYLYNDFTGQTEPNLNEFNLRWLSLFVTLPGLVVMWIGLAVVALQRAKPALYVLLLPGVLLMPLYLWEAKVSARLMWWVRRFIPAVLPAICLLIAIALVWGLWHNRRLLRGAALFGLAGLVAFSVVLSWPLRSHREMGGSWDMAAAVAAPAGDEEGVFLFAPWSAGDIFDPLRNVPMSVWWIFGQTAARLPADYDMATIEAYEEAFPDRPLFVVVHDTLPTTLPADRFEVAGVMQHVLTHWEEWPWGQPAEGEAAHRPSSPIRSPKQLVIWRLLD